MALAKPRTDSITAASSSVPVCGSVLADAAEIASAATLETALEAALEGADDALEATLEGTDEAALEATLDEAALEDALDKAALEGADEATLKTALDALEATLEVLEATLEGVSGFAGISALASLVTKVLIRVSAFLTETGGADSSTVSTVT